MYSYCVGDCEERYNLETGYDDPRRMAEDAARDHVIRSNWGEVEWPLDVNIYRGDECIGSYVVRFDMRPIFMAKSKE